MAPDDLPPFLPLPFGDSLLAYIDIVGFKGLIGSQLTLEAASVIGGFTSASTDYVKRTERFTGGRSRDDDSAHISSFSDTIVISCTPVPDDAAWLVHEVQRLCSAFVSRGIYTRGAVTVGGLFHKDSTIIGPALIEVHEIEQQVAKYPRVVVTDSALELLRTLPGRPPQIRTDLDGLTILELFAVAPGGQRTELTHRLAAGAKAKVEADLARTRDSSEYKSHSTALNHRAQYGWLLSYLDKVLAAPVFRRQKSSE